MVFRSMATPPTKRRKTNNFKSSPQAVRSLDFFFEKQRKEVSSNTRSDGVDQKSDSASRNVQDHHSATQSSNDEELARRLQLEWDEEERGKKSHNGTGGPGGMHVTADKVKMEEFTDAPIGHDENATLHVSPFSENEKALSSKIGSNTGSNTETLSLQSTASTMDLVASTVPFGESPLTFDPAQYLLNLKEQWAKEGGDASYGLLTRCFVLVNSTQSRIKIVDTLVNFLRVVIEGDYESLLPAVNICTQAQEKMLLILSTQQVWLATNAISPPYISLELGLGGSAISKALKKMCGLDGAGLKALYDKHGDAGDVAFEAKKRQSFTLRKPKPLSIKAVFHSLVKIANSKGNGSQEFKQRIVEKLLQDAQGAEESRYLVRTLAQHLRIGAVKTTMLIALSRAFLLSRPPSASYPIRLQSDLVKLKKEARAETYASGEELVKACFARRPNYNDLVPCLLEVGISKELLVRCGLALHIPLRPMLGSITRDLGEMLTKLQGRDFSCEYKYDGQRAQVHCDDQGKVSIFSRHLEVMTDKYPDLVALVPTIRGEGVGSFILEGEVVAVDRESGELKAFQTLTNRARKDVAIGTIKVDVCLFSFDLMYLNGEELLARPFRERRELLRSLFVEIPNQFTWVKSIDATSSDSDAVLEFFKSATDFRCEGIMVKVLDNVTNSALQMIEGDDPEAIGSPSSTPTLKFTKTKTKASATEKPDEREKGTRRKALLSTYEPDKRLDSWLKVKKDYNTSADTIDLIPVAAWHGQGRKAKWWSPILLAVRNPETGSLEAVTKCISGFSDKFYQANKEKYEEGSENVIARPGYVEYDGRPDVWFEPQEVWEMAFADITRSPTYPAAMGLISEDRGLSMRFPRFLKVREDKSIEEASTARFLADLWMKQEARVQPGSKTSISMANDAEEYDE